MEATRREGAGVLGGGVRDGGVGGEARRGGSRGAGGRRGEIWSCCGGGGGLVGQVRSAGGGRGNKGKGKRWTMLLSSLFFFLLRIQHWLT